MVRRVVGSFVAGLALVAAWSGPAAADYHNYTICVGPDGLEPIDDPTWDRTSYGGSPRAIGFDELPGGKVMCEQQGRVILKAIAHWRQDPSVAQNPKDGDYDYARYPPFQSWGEIRCVQYWKVPPELTPPGGGTVDLTDGHKQIISHDYWMLEGRTNIRSSSAAARAVQRATMADWVGWWDTSTSQGGYFRLHITQDGDGLKGEFVAPAQPQFNGAMHSKPTNGGGLDFVPVTYVQPGINGDGEGTLIRYHWDPTFTGVMTHHASPPIKFNWSGRKLPWYEFCGVPPAKIGF